MLNLKFIDGSIVEMQEGQELAVKDLLKDVDPETIVFVCDEDMKILETIPLGVLFDIKKDK
jgi:hypothetical protein